MLLYSSELEQLKVKQVDQIAKYILVQPYQNNYGPHCNG